MLAAEDFQKHMAPLFPGLMGIKILEANKDKIIASMRVRPDLCTSGGLCHGGAYMALADTLGAIGTVVNLPPNTRTTTIESKTNFLGAAAVDTEVTAESVPLHRGRTTQVWQTTIKSQAGKLCAVVMQTQMVLPPA
jgi:uncharacterized protein (TIGR00369 family)